MEEYILDMMYDEWGCGFDGADILKNVVDKINEQTFKWESIEYNGYVANNGWLESNEEIGVLLIGKKGNETFIFVKLPDESVFINHP